MTAYSLRIPGLLFTAIHADLDRQHAFALERVGFLHCASARSFGETLLLAADYRPVADEDYLRSEDYGALVGPVGIRRAFERAYALKTTVIHVHRHEHLGAPGFSRHDEETNRQLIPSFWNVAPGVPHGALVLSRDRARCVFWEPATRAAVPAASIRRIGRRLEELA